MVALGEGGWSGSVSEGWWPSSGVYRVCYHERDGQTAADGAGLRALRGDISCEGVPRRKGPGTLLHGYLRQRPAAIGSSGPGVALHPGGRGDRMLALAGVHRQGRIWPTAWTWSGRAGLVRPPTDVGAACPAVGAGRTLPGPSVPGAALLPTGAPGTSGCDREQPTRRVPRHAALAGGPLPERARPERPHNRLHQSVGPETVPCL